MFNRKRKANAMAPQQTTTVELPEVIDVVLTNGKWEFPPSWSDEDKRDWLVTHPTTSDPDRDEYEQTYDQQVAAQTEEILNTPLDEINPIMEEVNGDEFGPAELKAEGTYAAGLALPPHLRDEVNGDNYDPREFLLVHFDVWGSLMESVDNEAELTQLAQEKSDENRELRKRVNALTRGMRKVNKHWSTTKRELKQLERENEAAHKEYRDLAQAVSVRNQEDRTRQNIFAIRLARRLRKARAGRDKRERQLLNLNKVVKGQDLIIDKQDEYIKHLENLLSPQFPRRS